MNAKHVKPIAWGLLLALASVAELAAYTVYLKDGSSIQAKEKYKISGDRALITLTNGQHTFVPASQVDVARTEKANKLDYGSAVVLQEAAPTAVPPPAPRSKSLSDLIQRGSAGPQAAPEARRPAAAPVRRGDSGSLARKPFAQLDAAAELQAFFRSQGIEEAEIYQGSQGRPLIEVTTNSEAAVFRALAVSAGALAQVRTSRPAIGGLELSLLTPSKERAGEFAMTPQMADDLLGKKVEVSAFFLDHVKF